MQVEGHLCVDCCTRLVRMVRTVVGVHTALLDIDEGILTLVHDHGSAALPRVATAVRSAGFQVRPTPPADDVRRRLAITPAGRPDYLN